MTPLSVPAFVTGLQTSVKSNILPDDGFSELNNAFVEDGQVKRRIGLKKLGRLRRTFTSQALGNTTGATTTLNIFTVLGFTDTNQELEPGSVDITIAGANASTFTDVGDGTFTVTGVGILADSWVDYKSGDVSLSVSPDGGASAITAAVNYFPGYPCMGIYQRELSTANQEQSVFFDRKYAYIYNATDDAFQELATGTTWAGSTDDDDFFHCVNWRGATGNSRLFFATNFISDASNPMRYFDTAWNTFAPLITAITTTPSVPATSSLFQAKILLPYYGRLIALNTYEGLTAAGAGAATNFYNRCTFSQIGNPLETESFQRNVFGRGGFIDAPVNQAIIGAEFYKNTLIVFFENSTWRLRYIGEYGLPFIFENIDSKMGSESTFSTVKLEEGVQAVGDKGIIEATSNSIHRIDDKIKNTVFSILNAQSGAIRVIGERDYGREMLYWCFGDSSLRRKFPNRTLVYNYKDKCWAIFRDNITFLGPFQSGDQVGWDSLTTMWDGETTWNDATSQSWFPFVASGNAQGFTHYYNSSNGGEDDPSLRITAIDRTVTPPVLTSVDHNLETGDIIYLEDLNFVTKSTGVTLASDLNDKIFQAQRVDGDTFSIFEWDGSAYVEDFSYTPATPTGSYMGGGTARLFPVLSILTKDFNPYQGVGKTAKFIKANFLLDSSADGQVSVRTVINTSRSVVGNLGINQQNVNTSNANFTTNALYHYHSLNSFVYGELISLNITWDAIQMNDIATQRNAFSLSGMSLFFKPGGKIGT